MNRDFRENREIYGVKYAFFSRGGQVHNNFKGKSINTFDGEELL